MAPACSRPVALSQRFATFLAYPSSSIDNINANCFLKLAIVAPHFKIEMDMSQSYMHMEIIAHSIKKPVVISATTTVKTIILNFHVV